jgi:MFS family permease
MANRGLAPPEPVTTARPGARRLFATLVDYRDYRLLWASSVTTQIAQWMLQISLAWLMLELTDSPFWVGLYGFASGVPFLLVSIPAGALIDRLERRTLLVTCQASALAIGLALAVLTTLELARPWHLLFGAFLNGTALVVNSATRQTLVPTFVPREGLQNAIALLSMGMNITRVIGPSLAGPLIATLGSGGALFVQVACLGIALGNTLQLPSTSSSGRARLSFSRNLFEGFESVRRSSVLVGLMLLAAIPTVLAFPYLQLLPVYARDLLAVGAGGLGLLYTAGGLGALAGSLFVAGFQSIEHKGRFILATTFVYGLVLVVFAYSTWLPLSLLMLFCGGLLGSSYMSINNTLLHLHVRDEVRGRVMGIYMMTWGFMPLGALPMGFLGEQIGVPHAIALGAVLSSLATLAVAVRIPALRTLR